MLRCSCNAPAAMRKGLRLLPVCVLLSLLTACITHSITNLTATSAPRNPNNQYLIEYAWDTTQQSIRPISVTPHVIVGFDSYPMRPILKMTNRWEAYVPCPPDKNEIVYHFKVDYEYSRFGKPGQASKLSPEYKLVIK